jgi:hypothetical protein
VNGLNRVTSQLEKSLVLRVIKVIPRITAVAAINMSAYVRVLPRAANRRRRQRSSRFSQPLYPGPAYPATTGSRVFGFLLRGHSKK